SADEEVPRHAEAQSRRWRAAISSRAPLAVAATAGRRAGAAEATRDREGGGAVTVTLPPQSVEAERAVLGAILLEGVAGYRKLTTLTARADLFWIDANRETFTAMQRLAARGDGIDIVTVSEELRAMGVLERVGGPAFLALLEAEGCILNNLANYETIVVDAATKRTLLQL